MSLTAVSKNINKVLKAQKVELEKVRRKMLKLGDKNWLNPTAEDELQLAVVYAKIDTLVSIVDDLEKIASDVAEYDTAVKVAVYRLTH